MSAQTKQETKQPALPQPPAVPPGTKTHPGVKRAKANGDVELDFEGSIDAALSVGRLEVRNKKPGMDYCWVHEKRMGEARGKLWVVARDPDLWTPHRDGIDGAQQSVVHRAGNLVLMERPMRITEAINKRKAEKVDKTERRAARRVESKAAEVRTSLEIMDAHANANFTDENDDGEPAAGLGADVR